MFVYMIINDATGKYYVGKTVMSDLVRYLRQNFVAAPFHAVSGRITELLEDGLVCKSAEIQLGGHVIYLEKGESSPEKDDQAVRLGRASQKAEIVRLVLSEDYWGALRVAHEHNIPCKIALPEVTI